jgi:hypothetical protein
MKLVNETGASVAFAAVLWAAAAADLGGGSARGSIEESSYAAPFNWTRLYGGANAGYAWRADVRGRAP